MDRDSFQRISKSRLAEARVLLKAGHYSGAYYLIGYSVECALKACVSKQFKKNDLPDKKFVNDIYTHDLEKLFRLAELYPQFEKDRESLTGLDLNWAVVKDWTESSRYDIGISENQARDMYSACTSPKYGILSWVMKRW